MTHAITKPAAKLSETRSTVTPFNPQLARERSFEPPASTQPVPARRVQLLLGVLITTVVGYVLGGWLLG